MADPVHHRTSSPSNIGGAISPAAASLSPFAGYPAASALQHAATHLHYASCPSLTGELLRGALSEYLRTQVCHVTQVVVLHGFNEHGRKPEEEVNIGQGKLCYAAVTQCELVLIDRHAIGELSLSAVAPTYEEIMKQAARRGFTNRQLQMIQCTPFHVMHKLRVDSDREDQFQLVLRDDRGLGFPPSLVLSSVHRKAFCENLIALYNAHFQFAAMMPDSSAAISAAAQAALMAHAQVASSHVYTTQGVGSTESPSSSAPVLLDPLLHAGGALSLNRHIPNSRFSVLTTSSNYSSTLGRTRKLHLEFLDTQHSFKHPSEQFFAALPSKYRGNIFHRCGYMFETRKPPAVRFGARPAPGGPRTGEEVGEWADQAALFLNRPTATYRYQCASDVEKSIPLHQRKFMQVTVCPEKPITPFSCTVKSRDLRGHTPGRAEGKATLRELLRGRDDCDDDDFQTWAYAVGRAVAMNESRLINSSDYSEPQCKMYMKKMNVVGDKSSWVCYQMHIRTQTREIGLIACRRKCLPPYFDTFQDLVFVLYGPCTVNNQPLVPAQPGVFMEELELIVDTLSPSVVPLPYHYARGLSLSIIHPTYADLVALQGRMNALMFNSMSYHWLSTRAWISSTRGEFGIIPTTEFLGSACFKLAKSFANSILVRVTHRRERLAWAEYLPVAVEGIGAESVEEVSVMVEGEEPKPEDKDKAKEGGAAKEGEKEGEAKATAVATVSNTEQHSAAAVKHALVSDPLVIVSRMLTEFAANEAATRRMLGPQLTTYSAEEEWRCRVSQYLGYCIDDGIFPGALNIKRLLSVLSRAFLDAPILSADTSLKLDRVVDFLLYMKRRVGPPIALPSWRQAAASVAATTASRLGHRAAGLRAAHHQTKPVTAEVTNQHSPFASLSVVSPQSAFTEVPPDHAGRFNYDESTTLLQKLRDPTLLANFTCNEHIMIPLLDTSYIESLEKQTVGTPMYQEGSVIPALLAGLLTKDYNIDLIRAVRDKIISYDIHHEILIAPLIALLKDGTMQTSNYALHALTMLSRFHPRAVVEAGGASLAMWLIFMSKNELLLSASIDLILVLFSDDTRSIFAQPLFAMKLVDLLRKRVGGARYHNMVLQKTSALIFQLAKIPDLLHIFLASYAHRELVHILGEDEKRPILLDTSVCLGQLFVNAKNKMLGTPSENAKEDAAVIVHTMAKCTTRSQLRIALNLLVALQLLIRLPKAYYNRISNTMNKPGGGVQFTAPDKAFESRILVLQHLHTREGLENVLDRASSSADAELASCEAHLRHMNALEDIPTASGKPRVRLLAPEGDTSDPFSTAARILELIELHTIATNVNKNTRWFKMRMNYAVAAMWNINTLWQKDKRTFLAVPKE